MRETQATGARGTIVIVRSGDDEHVVVRLRAELAASAWRVLEIGPDARLATTSLGAIAASYTARAALRVHESDGKLELWVAGPSGASETLSAPGTRPEEGVLALRATEALRARGLEIDHTAVPPVGVSGSAPEAGGIGAAPGIDTGSGSLPSSVAQPATPPSAVQPLAPTSQPMPAATASPANEHAPAPRAAEAAPEPETESEVDHEVYEPPSPPWSPGEYARGLWLELAPALLLSPGHFPSRITGFAAARAQPLRDLSFALFGYAPFAHVEFTRQTEGTAHVTQFGLGAAAYFHRRFARFELELGGGGVFSQLHMTGKGEIAGTSRDVIVRNGGPLGAANLHYNVGGGFRIDLGATCAVLLKHDIVSIAKHEVASFGQPLVLVALGLELPILALGE